MISEHSVVIFSFLAAIAALQVTMSVNNKFHTSYRFIYVVINATDAVNADL